ncbi:hypothetical protein [Levilactobacillus senmaizukei]|nr:hypothetical protein [Levilactobacillus senmaizukei]
MTQSNMAHWVAGGLIILAVVFGLIGSSTTVMAARNSGVRIEKSTTIKADKRALKAATLNGKGLSLAWRAVIDHKLKLLKNLKKTISREQGTVYTIHQAKQLVGKINKLNKKYRHKLKQLKKRKDPADIHYAVYYDSDGTVAFMREHVKRVGNRTYIRGIQEHNGVFHKFGGHGAGFTVG